MTRRSIVQIATRNGAIGGKLYALDNAGVVWVKGDVGCGEDWEPLPALPQVKLDGNGKLLHDRHRDVIRGTKYFTYPERKVVEFMGYVADDMYGEFWIMQEFPSGETVKISKYKLETYVE